MKASIYPSIIRAVKLSMTCISKDFEIAPSTYQFKTYLTQPRALILGSTLPTTSQEDHELIEYNCKSSSTKSSTVDVVHDLLIPSKLLSSFMRVTPSSVNHIIRFVSKTDDFSILTRHPKLEFAHIYLQVYTPFLESELHTDFLKVPTSKSILTL